MPSGAPTGLVFRRLGCSYSIKRLAAWRVINLVAPGFKSQRAGAASPSRLERRVFRARAQR